MRHDHERHCSFYTWVRRHRRILHIVGSPPRAHVNSTSLFCYSTGRGFGYPFGNAREQFDERLRPFKIAGENLDVTSVAMPPPPLPAGAGLPPPPPAQYVISRYNGFIALQSVFVGLATASVLARLYVRSIVIKNLGLDELFVIFAFVEWSYLSWLVNDLHNQILSITTLAITVIMTHQRVDFVRQHPQMSNNILPGLKWQEISQPLTILSIMFTRVSICFFLLRIVGIGQSWKTRTWKWGLYSIMGLALITGIPVALITVLQCSPVEKLWSPMMAGTCWDPDITIAIGEFHGGKAPNVLS